MPYSAAGLWEAVATCATLGGILPAPKVRYVMLAEQPFKLFLSKVFYNVISF